jgi:MFS transporter, AAHS family, benzoate transport protein
MSKVNVPDIISESKFNRFHFWLLFWSCFIISFDMYDLVIYGSVLPVLMEEWSLSPVQAGAIGSYGFIGMMIGAILFGIVADKFGRKNVLIASVVLFSAATALCGFAPGPTIFSILRFFSGLGIGGVVPNVIALLTDYAPKKMRNMMVSIALCCFPIGGILAAFVAMQLIPVWGWEGVYWIGGIPLLMIPFMVKHLHDSPAILLLKGRIDDLRLVLSKINGQLSFAKHTEFEIAEEKGESGSPVAALFQNKRTLGTLMIWVAFFMCLLMVNGLTTWLPKLMVQSGYALNSSLTFMVVLNVGSIIGTLYLGSLADKYGSKKVLVPMFFISAISLSLLGFGNNMILLYLLIAITGACTVGAQNISYAFTSQYYPSYMRSTAIGLASGVGRIGAIVGPTFGGILLEFNISVQMSFIAFAIPGIIAAAAFALVPLNKKTNQIIGIEKNPRNVEG